MGKENLKKGGGNTLEYKEPQPQTIEATWGSEKTSC